MIDMGIFDNISYEQKELILKELRGFYSNSFFHIYVDGEFNVDINKISTKRDQGTVQHEYTHFIQNIGTLWGLYTSMFMYDTILEFKKFLLKNDNIVRPIKVPLQEALILKFNEVKFGNGTIEYYHWVIDKSKPFVMNFVDEKVNGKNKKRVSLKVSLQNGKEETIHLGAVIIKESMAAMYQSLLHPDAYHHDVPYNVVSLIAKSKYPNTAKDIRKLICCCHASLFSMNPGHQLIQLLDEAEQSPNLNGFELFEKYIRTSNIVTANGKRYSMIEYFNVMVEGFLVKLNSNITAETDYIKAALERVKLDKRFYPFLSVLYEGDYNATAFSNIIGYYGIPYIQTPKSYFFPKGEKEGNKEGSFDVLELIVQEAIYRNFTEKDRLCCCPLMYMCADSIYEKNECWDSPWKGGLCSYKIVSDSWGLDKKEIR